MGIEFHHLFLIILARDPGEFAPVHKERAKLFYNVETRDFQEPELVYFNNKNWHENSIWETTISASSECAYDINARNLGQLIKVPNFDRVDNQNSEKRVFVNKISSNNIPVIEKLLEFEQLYDNSLKYTLVPEIKKFGFNSNSYCRGALKHAGLLDELVVPSCFKSPGLSKTVIIGDNHTIMED